MEELGEKVLREYGSVNYFPFGNYARAPFILTSDPLGYLEAFLDSSISSIKRDPGNTRDKLIKAKYFTHLSKDFYNSSLNAKMPSRGTLIYYSFVNLTKDYLIISGLNLETIKEYHTTKCEI